MPRLALLALLVLSLAACDPVSGDDDPPMPPPGEVGLRVAGTFTEVWIGETWRPNYESSYRYDDRGRLAQVDVTNLESGEALSVTTYTYDAIDRVVEYDFRFTSGGGTTTFFAYEGDSDRVSESWFASLGASVEEATYWHVLNYDARGRLSEAMVAARPPATQAWEQCERSVYAYTGSENADQIVQTGSCYDPDIGPDQLALRWRYAHDGDHVRHYDFDRRVGDAWMPSDRINYTYTADGEVGVELHELYDAEGTRRTWIRTIYTYEQGPVAARENASAALVDPTITARSLVERVDRRR